MKQQLTIDGKATAADLNAADVYYFANPVEPAIPVMEDGGHLGFIATPAQHNSLPHGTWWMADNGAYSNTAAG